MEVNREALHQTIDTFTTWLRRLLTKAMVTRMRIQVKVRTERWCRAVGGVLLQQPRGL